MLKTRIRRTMFPSSMVAIFALNAVLNAIGPGACLGLALF